MPSVTAVLFDPRCLAKPEDMHIQLQANLGGNKVTLGRAVFTNPKAGGADPSTWTLQGDAPAVQNGFDGDCVLFISKTGSGLNTAARFWLIEKSTQTLSEPADFLLAAYSDSYAEASAAAAEKEGKSLTGIFNLATLAEADNPAQIAGMRASISFLRTALAPLIDGSENFFAGLQEKLDNAFIDDIVSVALMRALADEPDIAIVSNVSASKITLN